MNYTKIVSYKPYSRNWVDIKTSGANEILICNNILKRQVVVFLPLAELSVMPWREQAQGKLILSQLIGCSKYFHIFVWLKLCFWKDILIFHEINEMNILDFTFIYNFKYIHKDVRFVGINYLHIYLKIWCDIIHIA